MRKRHFLTVAELEIMQVVWKLGSCTVRDVYRALLERKEIAYTTAMTMMNVLEEKGHLAKNKEGRAFVYKPTRPQNQVISGMVDDFVKRVYGGSARRLVLSLVKELELSEEDLKSITRMIKKSEVE